jgi:phenylpropionate dioxygenase-like ring-hydroxylating dioxygenase large terminal subunit/putative sterol carrier protein
VGGRFPFPSFPRGWYVVAFSSDIAAGEVRTVHYFDRDIVLFRGAAGTVSAVDPTCPHLGAHVGGGRVEGDCLRCPFHGWAFDRDGRCVEVPYAAKIPPKAKLGRWAAVEQNGLVFVHYAPDGAAPTWTPPVLEEDGWTPDRTIRWEIRSHPQEVAENTVDSAHLIPVHHVKTCSVRQVEQDDHVMRVVLDLVATGQAIGMPDEINDVELDVTLHGLGQIISRTHVVTAGLRTRQRIHPTPIDGDRIAIFAVENTLAMPDPEYTREIDDIFWAAFVEDFARDFPIWETKAYLERPLLAAGDGPIGSYRRWARQFYVGGTPAAVIESESEPAPSMSARGVLAGVVEAVRRRVNAMRPPAVATARQPAPSTASARRFDSVDSYFQSLVQRFDPTAAGELEAVFQWNLTGERMRAHFAEVKAGTITTAEGVHATPTITIEMSADDYLRMINGDLNGALAFSTGRGRLRGPVKLAMRMQKLFPLDRTV